MEAPFFVRVLEKLVWENLNMYIIASSREIWYNQISKKGGI